MATTVRVDDQLHARLRQIAAAEGRPIGEVIQEAVDRYEREKFWVSVKQDFERLRGDPAAWRAYQDEIALWDAASDETLADEEPYYSPEEEAEIDAEFAKTYGR